MVLSLLMQLNREAADLRVVRLTPRDDGESSLEGYHAAQRWLTTPG